MILPSALALGAHFLLLPVADRVPVLNVAPVCAGIAVQGGSSFRDPEIAKQKQDCMTSEAQVREELVKNWSNYSAGDKHDCIAEATMGGDSSYTELLTCLEMAHDVRNLQNEPAEPTVAKPRR